MILFATDTNIEVQSVLSSSGILSLTFCERYNFLMKIQGTIKINALVLKLVINCGHGICEFPDET